jgi:hypothetical protein
MNKKMSRRSDVVMEGLVTSALRAGTPMPVVERARTATAARFPGGPRGAAERSRAESYFWGVVRRRALAGEAPAIARLIVAASLADELREGGHAPEAVALAIT